jgi:hypothetical protein
MKVKERRVVGERERVGRGIHEYKKGSHFIHRLGNAPAGSNDASVAMHFPRD